MKRHQTTGAALLRIVRAVLREDLLTFLPKDRRLEALMVLSALAMAERELERDPPEDEAAAIARLLGSPEGEEQTQRRQLAEAIRAGRFDADQKLYKLASSGLAWRLLETDPRVLEGADTKP